MRSVFLYLFSWCLPYQLPAVISQYVWVPFADVSFSHSGYTSILMEPFTVIVRGGSHVSLGKIIHVGS